MLETRDVVFDSPGIADGADIWRIARDCGTLDLNSSYAYLLWCRDYSATSRVARIDGRPVGFVIGYPRPSAPGVLLVWQIAVDADQRGRGLAAALLDSVVEQGFRQVETTITADNRASTALFTSFAKRWGAEIRRQPLFTTELFPDQHEPEDLYRIGPLTNHQ